MIKAIWMSDLHFARDGTVLGHDPEMRLLSAIDLANQHHGDARMCIISGDMVNRGTVSDYKALGECLEKLTMPVLPMVGNHDDRALFRSSLSVPDNCMEKYIQYSITINNCLIVCLDTLKAGSDEGEFCAERQAWLQNVLKQAGDKFVYIFMHHPPMTLGLPMQDTENMVDGAKFLHLVSGFKCVKYLFIGHVHRPIVGTVEGIPFATMRSILYQAPAPQPEWNWDTFKPGEEAPNFGVISISGSSVHLQYIQFCKHSYGVES